MVWIKFGFNVQESGNKTQILTAMLKGIDWKQALVTAVVVMGSLYVYDHWVSPRIDVPVQD